MLYKFSNFMVQKNSHRMTSSVSTRSSGNFWLLLLEGFSSNSKWIIFKENNMYWHSISSQVSFSLDLRKLDIFLKKTIKLRRRIYSGLFGFPFEKENKTVTQFFLTVNLILFSSVCVGRGQGKGKVFLIYSIW